MGFDEILTVSTHDYYRGLMIPRYALRYIYTLEFEDLFYFLVSSVATMQLDRTNHSGTFSSHDHPIPIYSLKCR